MLSDTLHGGLAHDETSILPSGRLGISREERRTRRQQQEVEDSLGVARTPGGRVVPLVVTNAPLLGSYLSASPVTIVAVDEFSTALAAIDQSERRRGR
jgi:hypothetical protein